MFNKLSIVSAVFVFLLGVNSVTYAEYSYWPVFSDKARDTFVDIKVDVDTSLSGQSITIQDKKVSLTEKQIGRAHV